MNKHPYHIMIHVVNQQRNKMIEEFRFFKRNPVNRKWLQASHYSHTVNLFRYRIGQADRLLNGARKAIKLTRETGITHYYDWESNSVNPELK